MKENIRQKHFWLGVASNEHVKTGVSGGFCQLCHGKAQPLKRMAVGDWIIYYSSKERFNEPVLCQKFTAIGEITGAEVYQHEMFPGFIPYRRDVRFLQARDIPIQPLISQLLFIKDKTRWGYPFRFGYLEIPRSDFELIAKNMLGFIPDMVNSEKGNK